MVDCPQCQASAEIKHLDTYTSEESPTSPPTWIKTFANKNQVHTWDYEINGTKLATITVTAQEFSSGDCPTGCDGNIPCQKCSGDPEECHIKLKFHVAMTGNTYEGSQWGVFIDEEKEYSIDCAIVDGVGEETLEHTVENKWLSVAEGQYAAGYVTLEVQECGVMKTFGFGLYKMDDVPDEDPWEAASHTSGDIIIKCQECCESLEP